MDNLYLAGLLERGLSIAVRRDSFKLVAIYRSPSLVALQTIQQAFGGIVHPHHGGRPYIRLNVTSIYLLAETLLPLSTPQCGLYHLILTLRGHKASYDNSLANKDTPYRLTYNQRVDEIAAQIHAFVPTAKDDRLDYIRGGIDAKTINQDPVISTALVWNQSKNTITERHRNHKAAQVKARLETHEQERLKQEKAKKEDAAARLITREANRAAKKIQFHIKREAKRADSHQRDLKNKEADLAKREKTVADITLGIKDCGYCCESKPINQFSKNAKMIGGYQLYCKQCVHEHYVKPNREYLGRRCQAWQAANPEKFKASCKKQSKKPTNRLRNAIRGRLKAELDRKVGPNEHISYLGCSIPDLRAYIEIQWTQNMTWETYGSGPNQWSIDHIVPHNAFNHQNEQHLHWCWNYRNLRPLWASENVRKSDIISGTSVRQYRTSGRQTELHTLVASELERLGITTKESYLASITTPIHS